MTSLVDGRMGLYTKSDQILGLLEFAMVLKACSYRGEVWKRMDDVGDGKVGGAVVFLDKAITRAYVRICLSYSPSIFFASGKKSCFQAGHIDIGDSLVWLETQSKAIRPRWKSLYKRCNSNRPSKGSNNLRPSQQSMRKPRPPKPQFMDEHGIE